MVTKEPTLPVDNKLFEAIYPDIESIRIQVIEKGHGITAYKKKLCLFEISDIGRTIKCSNRCCDGGILKLRNFVDQLYRRKKESLELTQWCQGNEVNYNGIRRIGACPNQFEIDIKIEYY